MSGLIQTIGSIFDPVLNFFVSIWNGIVFIFSFLWDLIEGLYYGFNTIISYAWVSIEQIIGVPFFANSGSVTSGLVDFMGVTYFGMFWGVLMCIIFLIVLRWVRSLIPFFRK